MRQRRRRLVLMLVLVLLVLQLLLHSVGAPDVSADNATDAAVSWHCRARAIAQLGPLCNATNSSVACMALNSSCEWVASLPPAPPSALPLCEDDDVWRFNTAITCASFAVVMGAERCAESWAVGLASDGSEQLAASACARACFGHSPGPQHCVLVAPTCADANGDAVEDPVDICSGEAFALPGTFDNATDVTAASVECVGGVCEPSECCTEVRPEPEPEPEPEYPEPEPANVTWVLGGGAARSALDTGSCDAVCAALRFDMVCVQSELDALSNESNATLLKLQLLEMYATVGLSCPDGLRVRCENGGEPPGHPGANSCEVWGSPYVHNGLLASGVCYGGTPFASCSAVPVNGNHRRLCPCAACNASDADDALCNGTLVAPLPPPPEPEPEPELVLSDGCASASMKPSVPQARFGAVVVSDCFACEGLLASAHVGGARNRSEFCYCRILNFPSDLAKEDCRQRGGAFCSVSLYANLTKAQGGGSLHVDGSNYGCFASECINENDLMVIASLVDHNGSGSGSDMSDATWEWGSDWFAPPGSEGWPFGYFQSFRMNGDQALYGSGMDGRARVRFELQCGDVPEPEPEPEPPEPEPEPEPPEPAPTPEPEPLSECEVLEAQLADCFDCTATVDIDACVAWGVSCGEYARWRTDCNAPEPEPEPEPVVWTLATRLALQFNRDVNVSFLGPAIANLTGLSETDVQIEVLSVYQEVRQKLTVAGGLFVLVRADGRRQLRAGIRTYLYWNQIDGASVTIDSVHSASLQHQTEGRRALQGSPEDAEVHFTVASENQHIASAFSSSVTFVAELVSAINSAGTDIPTLDVASVVASDPEILTQIVVHVIVPDSMLQRVLAVRTELRSSLVRIVEGTEIQPERNEPEPEPNMEVPQTPGVLRTLAIGLGAGFALGMGILLGYLLYAVSMDCYQGKIMATKMQYFDEGRWHYEISKPGSSAEGCGTDREAAAILSLHDRPRSRESLDEHHVRPTSSGSAAAATPPRTPDTNAFSPEHVRNRERRRSTSPQRATLLRQQQAYEQPEQRLQLTDVWDPHSPIVDLTPPRADQDPRRSPHDTGTLRQPPTLPTIHGHDFEAGQLSPEGASVPPARVLDARKMWDAHRAARRRERSMLERSRQEASASHSVLDSTLELSKRAVKAVFETNASDREGWQQAAHIRNTRLRPAGRDLGV